MSDHDTLRAASEKALWLELHYDEMPSRCDPHITDVIKLAAELVQQINAIADDSIDWGREAFGSNRIRARAL